MAETAPGSGSIGKSELPPQPAQQLQLQQVAAGSSAVGSNTSGSIWGSISWSLSANTGGSNSWGSLTYTTKTASPTNSDHDTMGSYNSSPSMSTLDPVLCLFADAMGNFCLIVCSFFCAFCVCGVEENRCDFSNLRKHLNATTNVFSNEALEELKKLDRRAVEFNENGHRMILTRCFELYCEIFRQIDGISTDKIIHPLLSSLEMSTQYYSFDINEVMCDFFKQVDDKCKPQLQVIYVNQHRDSTRITVASLNHKANEELLKVGIVSKKIEEAALKDENFPRYYKRMKCTNSCMFVVV